MTAATQAQTNARPQTRPTHDQHRRPRPRPRHERILVPVAVDAAVDAASTLAVVHQRVERQFALYEQAQADGQAHTQYQAVKALRAAYASSAALEEELLYPLLRRERGHGVEIDRQLEQNHLIGRIFAELYTMIPSDRRYDAKVRLLMDLIRQHAHDAGRSMRDFAGSYLDRGERERLGLRMLERLGQLEGVYVAV
ncbi:MAG: hypothetical protein L0Y54_24435 [Sporichthyaceae bacterium]|nr:hypothetical protein [Sporichthyaceae bacterium]